MSKSKWDNDKGIFVTLEDKEETKGQDAEMEQAAGILRGITNIKPLGLPLGDVVIGASLAILIDRLIVSKFAAQLPVGGTWINLGSAFVIQQYGSKFLGKDAANAAAFVLVYEAVADTIDAWISGVLPGAAQSQMKASGGNGQGHHEQVPVSGYYSRALRR